MDLRRTARGMSAVLMAGELLRTSLAVAGGERAQTPRLEVTTSDGTESLRLLRTEARLVRTLSAAGQPFGSFQIDVDPGQSAQLYHLSSSAREAVALPMGTPSLLVHLYSEEQPSLFRMPLLPSAQGSSATRSAQAALVEALEQLRTRVTQRAECAVRIEVLSPASRLVVNQPGTVTVRLVSVSKYPLVLTADPSVLRIQAASVPPPPRPGITPLPIVAESVDTLGAKPWLVALAEHGSTEIQIPVLLNRTGAVVLWAAIHGGVTLNCRGLEPLRMSIEAQSQELRMTVGSPP